MSQEKLSLEQAASYHQRTYSISMMLTDGTDEDSLMQMTHDSFIQGAKYQKAQLMEIVNQLKNEIQASINFSSERCDCGAEGKKENEEDSFCDCCEDSYGLQKTLTNVNKVLDEMGIK